MIKAIALFNFLEYHSPYSKSVIEFLKAHDKATSWNYVLDLLNLIKTSWENYKENQPLFFPSSFKVEKGYVTLFEQFKLNVVDYQNQYGSDKKNFSGIKEKPLFYIEDTDSLIVINWNFITNKLYEGLLFDFYKYSGIANEARFKNFLKFKQYVSYEVTEKFIFRRLISPYFKRKNSIIFFDEGDSFPDCYCRQNKNIFLIEIKDAYFPSSPIDSFSYPIIKEAIDKKYNSNNKGVGQIIKNIQKVIENHMPLTIL